MDFEVRCPLVRYGRLLFDFCPSTRTFVPCFLRTSPRGDSPCIIARPSPPSGRPEDFHLQVTEHAQHTTMRLSPQVFTLNGRTRQCVVLAMFGIAGVSVALTRTAKQKFGSTLAMAITIVILCHLFGTQPSRDDLPLADRRREHMDRAVQFIRRQVSPAD